METCCVSRCIVDSQILKKSVRAYFAKAHVAASKVKRQHCACRNGNVRREGYQPDLVGVWYGSHSRFSSDAIIIPADALPDFDCGAMVRRAGYQIDRGGGCPRRGDGRSCAVVCEFSIVAKNAPAPCDVCAPACQACLAVGRRARLRGVTVVIAKLTRRVLGSQHTKVIIEVPCRNKIEAEEEKEEKERTEMNAMSSTALLKVCITSKQRSSFFL